MAWLNMLFGWCWILVGMIAGAGIGLFFHRADWLGGYDSWRRRMVRLGHIAFLGTGILNVLFGLTLTGQSVAVAAGPLMVTAVWAAIAGAVAMPITCFLAAAWRPARHAFFAPVACLLYGLAVLIWKGLPG